jgi:hypothetical protein
MSEESEQAFIEIADALVLDEFQRIAVRDILTDLKKFDWPPEPDSEHERLLIQLGAIIAENI